QQQAMTVEPDHPCRMPNAERLASEGLRFNRAYTVTAHCCPSRASFMTGLYPSRHGIHNNIMNRAAIHTVLNEGVSTFGESLAASGYRMLYSGKWHVTTTENPCDRGWEELLVTAGKGTHHGLHFADWKERARRETPSQGARARGTLRREGWGDFRLYGTSAPRPDTDPYHPGDLRVVHEAVRGIESLSESDQPWCLYVGTIGPHDPYIVPEHYARMYDPADVELPPNYADAMEDKPRVYQRQRRFWSQLSDDEVRESIAHYWGFCTMQDDLLGITLDALEASGMADDTLVVYTSDHGDCVGAHGLYLKGVAAFDETYRIPLVMRWRNGIASPGREVDEFISMADFAPTFVELAGSDPPAHSYSGNSLVPFLRGETPSDWRDAFYSQFDGVELYYSQRVVQTKRWKYVYNGFDFDELYDLENDPHEMRNRIDDPELADVVRSLSARLWRFAAQEDDLIGNPYPTVSFAPFGPMVGFRSEDT
ncbi:DUF4976 domain-containing protein, partial [Candidatus Poribacteria bacterium]|nr:DUF4976 domain-containing protein [Candidatus Poribacteria bacterium]